MWSEYEAECVANCEAEWLKLNGKLKCEVECKADAADFEDECESEYKADITLKRKYVRPNVRLNKCESK